MKKIIIIIFFIVVIFLFYFLKDLLLTNPYADLPIIQSTYDQDNDGIDDFADLFFSAKKQIGIVTKYDTAYFSEAYPPEDKGACADIIWRSFEGAGYNFKIMIDQDIDLYPNDYPDESNSDSNINFRRVRNIKIFLDKYAYSLSTEIIPNDKESIINWQLGDIVTYDQISGGLWHIAIISDKRNKEGIPFLIHNYGTGVQENDYLLKWPSEITGHYRWGVVRLE